MSTHQSTNPRHKLCPFCGERGSYGPDVPAITCTGCGATGPTVRVEDLSADDSEGSMFALTRVERVAWELWCKRKAESVGYVIEFRSGNYLQPMANSGPLETAIRFDSAEEAEQLMNGRKWMAFNGAMVIPDPASPHQQELERAWQQGWDERERRGALAGAFERGPEFNPYRVGPPPQTWFNTKKVHTADDVANAVRRLQQPAVAFQGATPTLKEQRLVELSRVISGTPLRMREVLQTIWFLVQQVEPDIALPTLGFNEDGGAYFGWNPGDRSLDVAIHLASDGTYSVSWFYASHITSEQDTSDKSPHQHGYLQYVRLFR